MQLDRLEITIHSWAATAISIVHSTRLAPSEACNVAYCGATWLYRYLTVSPHSYSAYHHWAMASSCPTVCIYRARALACSDLITGYHLTCLKHIYIVEPRRSALNSQGKYRSDPMPRYYVYRKLIWCGFHGRYYLRNTDYSNLQIGTDGYTYQISEKYLNQKTLPVHLMLKCYISIYLTFKN